MSRQGAVGPLRLRPYHAATVGALIEARTAQTSLDNTPLVRLPEFGRKLRAAAKRKRKPGSRLTIWDLDRDTALAGFNYLALFAHPSVPESFLAEDDAEAVREVTL